MDFVNRMQLAFRCCGPEEAKSQEDMVVVKTVKSLRATNLAMLRTDESDQKPQEDTENPQAEQDKAQEGVHRFQVGGGGDREVKIMPPSPKTGDELQLLSAAVKNNKNLAAVLQDNERLYADMMDWAWKEVVPAGSSVITQGDINSDYFYVIQEGAADVIVNDNVVGQLKAGSSFGELALLFLTPRAATIKTIAETTLWVLDRGQFKAILARAAEAALKKYIVHMMQISGMENISKRRKKMIAHALEEKEYIRGDIIYREGDPMNSFFIITEGEVAMLKGGVEKSRMKGSSEEPIILGHNSMVAEEPRAETVRVLSHSLFAMALEKQSFDALMAKKKKKEDVKNQSSKISLQDLKPLGVLGAGGFGLVELVEHSRTHETYALKSLSKGWVLKSGMQSGVHSERDIMFMCKCPFIVKLYETYCTDQRMCFLMEPVLGGELYEIYQRHKFHGSKSHCQYYIAGVIFAFEHMHSKKIIYRDLKPENILLNAEGCPKLTDMGLAKVSYGKAYTACGSLVAMAPEVVKGIGHNQGADWWTLGVLIFELMSGRTPFQGDTPTEIYNHIFEGIDKVQFDKSMQGSCEDLIKQLCHPQSSKRIAMLPNGVNNIKAHMWFRCFDWNGMQACKLDAPYKPEVKSNVDMTNFKADIPNVVPSEIKYTADGTEWESEFATSQ